MRRIGDHAFEGTQHLGRMIARLVCRDWMRLFDVQSKASIEELFAEVAKNKSEGLRRFAKGFLHRSDEYYYQVSKSYNHLPKDLAIQAFTACLRQTWISLITDNDVKSVELFARGDLYVRSMVVPNDRIYVFGGRITGKTTLIKAMCRRLIATNLEWGMPSISEHQTMLIKDAALRSRYDIVQAHHYINCDKTKPRGGFYVLIASEEGTLPSRHASNMDRLKLIVSEHRIDEIDRLMMNPPPRERNCSHWLFVSLLNDIQVWLSLRLTEEEKQLFGIQDHYCSDQEEDQEDAFDSEALDD